MTANSSEYYQPLLEATASYPEPYPSYYYNFLDDELNNIAALLNLDRSEIKLFAVTSCKYPVYIPQVPIKKVGLKSIPYIYFAGHHHSRLHRYDPGYTLYEVNTGSEIIRYVSVVFDSAELNSYAGFIVIAPGKFWKLIRYGIRCWNEKNNDAKLPIMEPQKLQLILDNTINFLKQKSALKEYGVKTKNGLLLTGPPGNGKTMICNYIKSWCVNKNIDYFCISPTELHRLIAEKELDNVLKQNKVVFFDDIDISLLNSSEGGHSTCSLKSAMSGMNDADVSIKIFTTNEDISAIDPALRRPGRIDVFVEIDIPTESLRREYIEKFWPSELVSKINPELIAKRTDGYSFAELELIGSIAVRHKIFHNEWNIDFALTEFQNTRNLDKKVVGF